MDVLPHTFGSAGIVSDETIVLAGITASIASPYPELPSQGIINILVDYPDNNQDSSMIKEKKTAIESLLSMLWSCNDLNILWIAPGQCWKLDLDVLVLSDNGNVVEMCFDVARLALFSLRLPSIEHDTKEGPDLILGETLSRVWSPQTFQLSQLLYILKVGSHFIMDPLMEEEECSSGGVYLVIDSDHGIVSMFKAGPGSFSTQDLKQVVDLVSENTITRFDPSTVETGTLLDLFDGK